MIKANSQQNYKEKSQLCNENKKKKTVISPTWNRKANSKQLEGSNGVNKFNGKN